METERRFPGVLWLLPICFGLVGGVIAALIASLKYQASWLELALVGLIVTVVAMFGYLAYMLLVLEAIF